jgi:TANFOR domain-containing protein
MKSLHFCKPLQPYLPLYLPDYKLFTNLKQANPPMRRQLLISLLLLFLVARSAMAQTFPVQASTNIVPPYSTLLADYVAPGSQRLALNIFLADLNRPQLQTRLRLRIEGEGISITTRPSFMPPPLILQGGIPERLTGTDLAEYFLPQNLDFTGITRRQFESTGKLPEGLYRFCFEILEYNRGVKVSNAACTMAWLILNDLPLINWPDQGEKLTPQDPQYITFQWTPRHTGSPNSAFTTEYDFALVALWPANRNPNDAILTTPPIFETTTQSTTLIYGPEATPLVPGRSYAFRVRARAIIGTESYDLFKNQGYSEAIGFVYGDACTLPTNINARATSGERFNISWQPATVHTNFNVRYRPAIRTADQWYEETTFLQNLDIGGLTAETTYEYQVAAGCGPFLSEYSDIASVTTESRPPVNYTCGLPPKEYGFENREPLLQLNVDDVVLAGDFEVRMMEVSGSNGNFSGKGRALVPYLDNMLVVVEFDQVSVNTDYRLIGGQMDVKGFGADILPDEVNDFLDELDESLDAIENTLDDIATGLDVADSIADQVQDLANDILDDGPLTIEDEERLDAATVAMYLEGAQQAAEAAAGALAAALTPESIETAAREVARAMELTKRGRRLRQIHDNADTLDAIAVEFFASENYGFDISRYRQHRLHYNIMVTADDETHRIPWVATAAGQQETVSARLTGNTGTDAADVAFESDGTALQATMTGDTWSITLPAMEAGAQRSIVALSSTTGAILGKLDAIAYEPIGRKVNLVPVGSTPAGLNAGDILTALNDTYRQAVASWEVAVLDPLTVDGYTGTLQDDEQALLSVYSTGMREIIRAFEATGAVNEDEFYLFLVDRSQVGNTGYMPRKHRYGFIYMEDNPDVPRTVAHELGHGAFRLQHTFEEYPTIGGPRSTANLMDYGTGTKLRKYQWDLIHNPPLVIGLLEDEGEGALAQAKWFTPDWQVFAVASVKSITGDLDDAHNGAVPGFVDGSMAYEASFNDGRFVGYLNSEGEESAVYKTFPDYEGTAYLHQDNGGCNKNKYFKTDHQTVKSYLKNGVLNESVFDLLGNGKIIPCAKEGLTTYFKQKNNRLTEAYINYFLNRSLEIDNALANNSKLIGQLTALVASDQDDKDERLLGLKLADKLKSYEVLNNRKFIIVTLQIHTLCTNQNTWNAIAEEVFEKAGLASDAILITVPYVLCEGIVGGNGKYYFMPGLAFGSNAKIELSKLRTNYSNTQRVAEFATHQKFPVGEFIEDVFTNTYKKAVVYRGIYNGSNAIEAVKYEKDNVTGLSFNKTIELYRQQEYTKLANVVKDWEAANKGLLDVYKTGALSAYDYANQVRFTDFEYRKEFAKVLAEVSQAGGLEKFTPSSNNLFIYKEEFIESTYGSNEDINAIHYIKNRAFKELQEELNYPYSDNFDYTARDYPLNCVNEDLLLHFINHFPGQR